MEEMPPILKAAQKGQASVVECFLKAGTDPNFKGKKWDCALYQATQHSHSEVVKLLLSYQANPNTTNSGGNTALHQAAVLGNLLIAELLIEAGASLRMRNERRQYPMHLSVKESQTQTLKLFLKKDFEALWLKDLNGKQAWEYSKDPLTKEVISKVVNWQERKALVWGRAKGKLLKQLPESIFRLAVEFL